MLQLRLKNDKNILRIKSALKNMTVIYEDLEYRVKVQYKKLSPKKIKELLLSVQHSTLVDKTRKIKYAIPSKTNVDINKLYRIMGLKKHTTPYILGKF